MKFARQQSLKYWDNWYSEKHTDNVIMDDWLERFSTIIDNCDGAILDIGCGRGNDTKYFIEKGKKVIACDQSPNAITYIKGSFPEVYETRCFNFLDGFDFDDLSFDIICADLCLHYFSMADTDYILEELNRIMKSDGHLFVRVNSLKDTLHGAGQGPEIEKHLYQMEDGTIKRFFDSEDIEDIFSDFDIQFCEEQSMDRYSKPKTVFTLHLRKKQTATD